MAKHATASRWATIEWTSCPTNTMHVRILHSQHTRQWHSADSTPSTLCTNNSSSLGAQYHLEQDATNKPKLHGGSFLVASLWTCLICTTSSLHPHGHAQHCYKDVTHTVLQIPQVWHARLVVNMSATCQTIMTCRDGPKVTSILVASSSDTSHTPDFLVTC